MSALATLMEIEVVSPVKFIETIEHVLASMRVDNVKEDGQTHAMCGVDKFFEVLWGTISRTCSKETGDLIPEGWDKYCQSL